MEIEMSMHTYSTIVENTHLKTLHQITEQERNLRLVKQNASSGGRSIFAKVYDQLKNWMTKTPRHAQLGSLKQTSI